MAAVALAAHVEQFGGSGYKRDFSQVTQPSAPSVRGGTALNVPSVTVGGSGAIPATSARPDQRVNARVPVARACYQSLVAGQVAFVSRSVGLKGSAEVAPAFVGTHAISLEHLNEILADPVHHSKTTLTDLLTMTTARSLLSPVRLGEQKKLTALAFDMEAFFKTRNPRHPLMQYALDGVVCTPSDDQRDAGGNTIGSSVGYCNVAVKGPAPVLTHRTPEDRMRAVTVSPYPQKPVAPNEFYLAPADILATVYVVLLATVVSRDKRVLTVRFSYELVSSSNLQTAHGYKRFTDTILEDRASDDIPRGGQNAFRMGARRLVLRVFQLGRVVDTKFGSPASPSMVVSVCIKPFEATRREKGTGEGATEYAYTAPVAVFNSFVTRSIAGKGLGATDDFRKARGSSLVTLRTPVSRSLLKLAAGSLGPLLKTSNAGANEARLAQILQSLAKLQQENKQQAVQIMDLVKKSTGDDHVQKIADRVYKTVTEAAEAEDAAAAAALAAAAAAAPPAPPAAAAGASKKKVAVLDDAFYKVVDDLTQVMLDVLYKEFGEPEGLDDVEEYEAYLNQSAVQTRVKNDSRTNASSGAAQGSYNVAVKRAAFSYDFAGETKHRLENLVRAAFFNDEGAKPDAKRAALEELQYLMPVPGPTNQPLSPEN